MQATEYVIVLEGCKPGVRIYIYSPLFGARLATQSILCFGFKWHFPPFARVSGQIPSKQMQKIDRASRVSIFVFLFTRLRAEIYAIIFIF